MNDCLYLLKKKKKQDSNFIIKIRIKVELD